MFKKRLLTGLIAGALFSTPLFAGTAFISNERDNTISVIDTKSWEVVKTFDVGMRPRGILLNSDYSKLYVCASDSDRVEIYDAKTFEFITDLPSGDDPEQFALHPNDRLLFIANEDDDIVSVVDTETHQVLAQIEVGIEPEGMGVSPDGKWAVNTSETTNMLHWIDTETLELVDNTVIDQRPRHVEFTHDSQRLWASAEIGGTVTIYDVDSRDEIHKINFEIKGVHPDRIQPVGIQLTQDGRYAFVALGPANHVAMIDQQTYEVLEYFLVGRRVWGVGLTPDDNYVISTNGVSGDVSIIDVEKREVIKTLKVGRYPWGVVAAP